MGNSRQGLIPYHTELGNIFYLDEFNRIGWFSISSHDKNHKDFIALNATVLIVNQSHPND